MEALVSKVEALAASLSGPAAAASEAAVSPTTRLAAMLKEALAANTIGGKPDDDSRVRAAQEAVPAGEPLLAYFAEPAFLEFRPNRVYVVDWPGESSLPPGMPVYAGGAAVREYLRGRGIRYVLYGYRREAGFPRAAYGHYVEPVNGAVVRRQAAGSFAFQADLRELEGEAGVIYRNGEEEVLDLGEK